MLEFSNVSFAYPRRAPLIRDFTFALKPGGFVMMLGANGSGKSTLLNLANGLLKPAAGDVMLHNRSLSGLPARLRAQKIATVFQAGSGSSPALTAEEIIRIGRNPYRSRFGAFGKEDEAAVSDAVERMDLSALKKRLFHELSGGERQRVMIAAALVRRSEYLLLDEPTSAADPALRIGIMRILRTLPWRPGVLIATHDLAAAELFADKILMLSDGTAEEAELTPAAVRKIYGEDAVLLLRNQRNGHE